MTAAIIFALVWLAGIAALLSRRFIRTRRDAWPLVAIWPALFSYVVFILLYEGGYRLILAARRRRRQP